MLRKQKWALLGGLILLALCMIIPGVMVLASTGSTSVSGTIPLNISNVQVTNITTTSATVSWNTNNPSGSTVTSQVSYGITTGYGSSVSDTSTGLNSVNLSSLLPGTKYYYQIQSTVTIGATAFSGTYAQAPVTPAQVFFTTASLPLNPIPSFTNVVLVSLPNPSDFGQTVDFGVAVIATKLNGIPTGTVTYKDGNNVLGTSTPDGLGLTSFKISTLSVGSHNITAVYGGDTHFLGSTSNVVVQKVHYDTKTSLTSSPNPSTSGQSVTFTATVTAAAGTPTGTVTFSEGSTVLGTGTLSSGKATYTTTALSVGSHPITASYGGDSNNDVSTSSMVMQVVNGKPKANVTLTSNNNPSDSGQTVKFTATVSSSGATGSVTFYDGSTSIGTATLSNGTASVSTSSLSVGSHNITAVYAGNTTYASSTSNTVIQKVRGRTTIVWPYKPSPCNWGHTCTFICKIGWQGPGNPTGYVTFYDGSNSLGNCNLSSDGSASFSVGNLGVGNHNMTVVYSGDDNNDGSTSSAVTQTVNAVSTSTSLSASVSTLVFGQSVNFTAAVNPSSATGTVTFKDGSKTLGTAALSGGSATFSINSLAVGSHSLTAVYSGDANDSGSTSGSITETVNKANTTISVLPLANPASSKSSVTFTATVSSPTATGTVTFKNGGTTLGTAAISGGAATLSIKLSSGTYSITAVYGGDSNFNGSTSSTISQTITK